MARPATPSPITVPPVKETCKAFDRLVRAACVVLTLAFVAIFIPIYPATAERMAPIRKEIAITGLEVSTKVPDQAKIIAVITAK